MALGNRTPTPPIRVGQQSDAPAPATSVERLREHVSHDSQLGELVPIYLKYVALTIITLGVYHFWARTHVRRFLWGHTRFLDDPLEYLGRPVELLAGFLLVLGLFVLPLLYVNDILIPRLAAEAHLWNPWKLALFFLIMFVQPILIPYLSYVGTYTARRYRLSRTAWRGIRGAQSGSAWLYGLRALLYWFLTLITLGWFYPWQSMGLAKRRVENSYFGDQQFSFAGTGSDLGEAFARFWFSVVGLSILSVVVFDSMGWADMEPGQLEEMSAVTALMMVTFLVMILVLYALLFLIYRSHEVRQIALASSLGQTRFQYTFTTWEYLRYVLGNILIFVLTLTTGWVYLQRRQFRFWRNHLEIGGSIDFARLRQTRETGPRAGEGLAEELDIGFDIGF